jgi:hypothetical protein
MVTYFEGMNRAAADALDAAVKAAACGPFLGFGDLRTG